MFDFLVQNKKKELIPIMEILTADIEQVQIQKLAIEKAVSMIAKAIAKSEIQIINSSGTVIDNVYYKLNVRPNKNETGTDFWMRAIYKLLTEGECLIYRSLSNDFYIVDNYTADNSVVMPRMYSNITITSAGEKMNLYARVSADDMIHLIYRNQKIRLYLSRVLKKYDETLSVFCKMIKTANIPKFKIEMDAQMPLIQDAESGKELSQEEYKKRLKALLESDELTLIQESTGLTLDFFKIDSALKPDDIDKMRTMEYKDAAMAFDIPELVYFGNITEKSDATNEFITYAVGPIAEVINDSFNAKLVGMKEYINGERCEVNLSHYKHVDIIDSASNLDKLRSIGFSLDEIRGMVGYAALNTEFSQKRALTKNYLAEGEEENEDEDKKE